MSVAPAQAQSPERKLEEGNMTHYDHATGTAPSPEVVEEKIKEEKRRRWHHIRREKHKEKLEAKLPPVMQGAKDVQDAERRMKIKNEIIAALGEFVGTFLFLFFSFGIATTAGQQQLTANSTQQVQGTGAQSTGTSLDTSQLLYSALGFGFSLAVNAWLFFRVSGGLFNPAVALALFLTGNMTWYRLIILSIVEFLGALSAAGMATVLLPGGLNARARLAGSTTVAQGFFIEMFMTAQLVFAIFMLAGEKHKGTFLAPVGIGLAFFVAEMWATPFTGGALNPVRSLAPDTVAHKFDGTCWIYYTAPYVGALLASGLYGLLKVLQYQTAADGQDADDLQLIMKDADGKVTGFVDKVAAPDAEADGILARETSRPASIISVDAPTTAVNGASSDSEKGAAAGLSGAPAAGQA